MKPLLHHPEDFPKLQELLVLGGYQWIRFEERDDSFVKIILPEDLVRHQIFLVIVMPPVAVDAAAAEVFRQKLKSPEALFPLDDHESWLNLPSHPHKAVSLDGTTETALPVDKADDPLLDSRPFLLIARTRRVVTEHVFHFTEDH